MVIASASGAASFIAAGVLFLALIVVAVRRSQKPQRDPQRIFTPAQRKQAVARCGDQCEFKAPFGRRCAGKPSQMDHIYPWSKGGATSMANLQGLCQPHNGRKSDWVPTRFYIWRLERRRLRYFPPNEPVKVIWRIGATPPPRRLPPLGPRPTSSKVKSK